jgi:MOSC domain-containing protein YiiM
MPEGRVHALHVSRGGVPKLPVEAAHLTPLGLEGDAVALPRIHGGPERALCLYALERIDALRGEGHSVFPGALGENVTTVGIGWDLVVPGVRLLLGEAEVEITRYAKPCATTAPYVSGDLARYDQSHAPGWSRAYARVLREGVLRRGDVVKFNDLAKK